MIFGLQGKISREEVARICIAALESPYACDKTFEVLSLSNVQMIVPLSWSIAFDGIITYKVNYLCFENSFDASLNEKNYSLKNTREETVHYSAIVAFLMKLKRRKLCRFFCRLRVSFHSANHTLWIPKILLQKKTTMCISKH